MSSYTEFGLPAVEGVEQDALVVTAHPEDLNEFLYTEFCLPAVQGVEQDALVAAHPEDLNEFLYPVWSPSS